MSNVAKFLPPVCCGIFMGSAAAEDALLCSKCGRKIRGIDFIESMSGRELRSLPRCECGVAKTGGNHSSWCPAASGGGRV